MKVNSQKIKSKPKIFGKFDLFSLREALHPYFQFNVESILLLLLSLTSLTIFGSLSNNFDGIFILGLYYTNYPPTDPQNLLISTIFMLLVIDFFMISLFKRPIRHIKHGYTINSSKDLNLIVFNQEIEKNQITKFVIFLIPRVIIYVLIVYSFMDVFDPNKNEILIAIYFLTVTALWLVSAVLLILFFVITTKIVLGLIVEDYINEGSTHSTVINIKTNIKNNIPQDITKDITNELDKVIEWVSESSTKTNDQTRKSTQYREKIANSLFTLRNYLATEETPVPKQSYTEKQRMSYVQVEKELTEELLMRLKEDKCVVCYASLKEVTGEVIACPVCGQGGHKDHIESWFATGKSECPICKSDVAINNYLLFDVK